MLPFSLRLDLRAVPDFFALAKSRRIDGLRVFWLDDIGDGGGKGGVSEEFRESQVLLTRTLPQEGLTQVRPSRRGGRVSKTNRPPNTTQSSTRFAIIVKKNFGNAPQRAKTKRLIRHAVVALHQRQPELFTTPRAVVLLAQGNAAHPKTQAEYEQSIKAFLEK